MLRLPSSSFHIIQQAQIDSKLSSNLYKQQRSYTQASIHITKSHIVILTHIDIYINSSHQNPGTMSAPKPSGGTTSSKPKNPGPQPVGEFGPKTYPRHEATRGDKECVRRVGTVTQVTSRPGMFQVTTGGEGRREFPTAMATHELNIPKGNGFDTSTLAVDKQYWIYFGRPKHSSDLIPYEFIEAQLKTS